MDSHIKELLSVGVLTGSRAFNCSTDESDYDIVILRSDCDRLMNGDIINSTDFTGSDYSFTYDYDPESGRDYSIMGFDLSDHEEFADETFIEYDKHTIWGPLEQIIKYYSPVSDQIVNLFVYADSDAAILPKFIELNNLMNFLYGHVVADRTKRIEAFTKVIKHVGITDY